MKITLTDTLAKPEDLPPDIKGKSLQDAISIDDRTKLINAKVATSEVASEVFKQNSETSVRTLVDQANAQAGQQGKSEAIKGSPVKCKNPGQAQ